MTREEFEQIIKKYRTRSIKLYPEHEAKSY